VPASLNPAKRIAIYELRLQYIDLTMKTLRGIRNDHNKYMINDLLRFHRKEKRSINKRLKFLTDELLPNQRVGKL